MDSINDEIAQRKKPLTQVRLIYSTLKKKSYQNKYIEEMEEIPAGIEDDMTEDQCKSTVRQAVGKLLYLRSQVVVVVVHS